PMCTPYAEDHPTVGQGPPKLGFPVQPVAAVYPHVVYECQDQAPGLGVPGCAVSFTGGLTFLHSEPVTCGYTNPGSLGHLRVGPDGYAYIAIQDCGSGGFQGVSASSGNGIAWSGVGVSGIYQNTDGNVNDPSIAVGRGN